MTSCPNRGSFWLKILGILQTKKGSKQLQTVRAGKVDEKIGSFF